MTEVDFTPNPAANDFTAPFWRSGLEGILRLQRCARCRHIRYPLSTICPRCLDPGYEWTPLSGRGTVQTFVTFDRTYHEAWAGAAPYVVALIELAEGPVMLSNVIGTPPDRIKVGDPVSVAYERRSANAALPQFRLTGGAQ
ncbi:MAG TPA: OB-fold domain-containing protein [Rugosimonospora sp.]|nr:OB-fold domain-containing protein [Rugosimonospora sp.]